MNDVKRMILAKKKINEYCKTCGRACRVAKALRGPHEILRKGDPLELKVYVQGECVGSIFMDDNFLLDCFCSRYYEQS